jgi:hypothetical protein
MTITRAKATNISNEAVEALKAVAEKYGMTVSSQGGSIASSSVVLKFQFAGVTETGVAETPEFQALKRKYPTLAGKEFDIPGMGRVTLTGWNHRAPKYPIQYTKDGKRFKAPAHMISRFHESFILEPAI